MTRNWEKVFQGGQGFTPEVILMLQQLEAELAANYAGSVHSVAAADASIVVTGSATDVELSAPGGGSQPVRLLDLGVITPADLADGIVTLYTPSEGEIVGPVTLRDVTFPDHFAMQIARDEQNDVVDSATFAPPMAGVDEDTAWDSFAAPMMKNAATFSAHIRLVPSTTGPVKAALCLNLPPAQSADSWQANHDYDSTETSAVVVEAGHIWESSDTFTSGGSKPDFAGNIGGSVSDGAGTWNDDGAVPSVGSMHVYAQVSEVVEP